MTTYQAPRLTARASKLARAVPQVRDELFGLDAPSLPWWPPKVTGW
ncbi:MULTISPECIES: hypothetical protein [Rhodococcus]|nr:MULTISPECIES: hypothetical protein [Rhodococcus]QQZ18739.1 hypothetical protein GO592_34910 [Rhodococcus sp. 21391]